MDMVLNMVLVEWYCTRFEIDYYGIQICTDWLVVI